MRRLAMLVLLAALAGCAPVSQESAESPAAGVSVAKRAAMAAPARCFEYDPPLLWDTSDNATASPANPRILAFQPMAWRGGDWVVANVGNRLKRYDITDQDDIIAYGQSLFVAPCDGDTDYNLRGFTVCDDCTYGYAGFAATGSVLFSFMDRETLLFGPYRYYGNAIGGFTFAEGGQQYLIASGLTSGCGNDAALYQIDAVDSVVNLGCLGYWDAVGGERYGGYLYVADTRDNVHVLRLDPGPTLVDLGTPIPASAPTGVDGGHGFSRDGDLLASASNGVVTIWDVSDLAAPALVNAWSPVWGGKANTVALDGGELVVIEPGINSASVWDVTDPMAPVEVVGQLPQQRPYSDFRDVLFARDGSRLLVARYSTGEVWRRVQCPAPPAEVFDDGFELGDASAWSAVIGD